MFLVFHDQYKGIKLQYMLKYMLNYIVQARPGGGGYKDTVIPGLFGIRYQYTQIWGKLKIQNTRNIGRSRY